MSIFKTIVSDFIRSAHTECGHGYFREIEEAVIYAQGLGQNSKNKFFRYEVVPIKFFQFLNDIGLLDAAQIPQHGINLTAAKTILESAGLFEGLSPSEFKALNLQKQSGSQQHVWDKSQLYNVKEPVWQQEQAERDIWDRL